MLRLEDKVLKDSYMVGMNCVISDNARIGYNVKIGHNCIIEDDVRIGDNTYIDSNVIIRKGTKVGYNSKIEAGCILGEHLMDFYDDFSNRNHMLTIGNNALIRSYTVIYNESRIGNNFQTGHHVTIRENSIIGNNVSIGTLSDIQGYCEIGDYVRIHSNVHIGQKTKIENYVWIFPYVVFTNDSTPPSEYIAGVEVKSFAIVATGALLLPGVIVNGDSLVAAGAVVTKNVEEFTVVAGNPAKVIGDVRNIKNKVTGENVYPWRYHFNRNMPWENVGYDEWYRGLDV